MKVKLKENHPGNRTLININGHVIQINKIWKEVTPEQAEFLYNNNNNVIDFFAPELAAMKRITEKNEITEEVKEEVKKNEDEFNLAKLKAMSKLDLELFAREKYGIELDRRKSLIDMIRSLKLAIESK
jgi:hypothetical protein